MFGLFSHSRRNASPKARPFRPTLEALEQRDCPSTISLTASAVSSSKMVTLTGQVTNTASPGGLTVQFGGVVSGTTMTDANGNFSATEQASATGGVSAATADGQSNTAQLMLSDPTDPVIDQFTYVVDPGNIFEFSGHVTSGYAGETVNFGGLKDLNGKTATLDANGNFDLTVQLDGQMDDNGDATTQAIDAWATTSNVACQWIMQTGGMSGGMTGNMGGSMTGGMGGSMG